MSADFESGFFVKKPAWHRLGQTIATAPNTREGIRLAGLDWTVQRRDIEVVPTLFTDAIPAEAEAEAKWPTLAAPQPDLSAWKALVRDTDQQALGVVGKGYNVLQNAEAFEFFDPLLSCGDATLETAGSLRKGKTIWVMARLKQDPLVVRGDDHVMPYLLLSNTHDATQAVRVNYTMVRVVCANTLAAAQQGFSGISIVHKKGVSTALKQVRRLIQVRKNSLERVEEEYQAMARKDITEEGLRSYVTAVVGTPREAINAKIQTAQQRGMGALDLINYREKLEEAPRAVDKIIEGFYEWEGQKDCGHSVWGAYNAITYWLEHKRGHNGQTRLHSNWFGPSNKLRGEAHKKALQLL